MLKYYDAIITTYLHGLIVYVYWLPIDILVGTYCVYELYMGNNNIII